MPKKKYGFKTIPVPVKNDLHEKVQKIAKKNGIGISQQVRMYLIKGIEQHEQELANA